MFTYLQSFALDIFNILNHIFIILHYLQDFFSIVIYLLNINLVLDIILIGVIILAGRARKIL